MAKTPSKKKTGKSKTKAASYQLDFQPGFWTRHWKQAVLIPLVAFGLYWMCLPYGYVLDDQIVITDNQFTKKGMDGVWDILSTESFSGYFGGQKDLVAGARYRPLSIVTFAIEQSFYDEDPNVESLIFLRHAINVLMYGLLGLLLFRILSLLFPNRENTPWLLAIPFVAVMLYLFHPVHSEVVANIKGRDEIMTALGAFGALYFSLRFLPSQKPIWLVLSGVSMFLGLMSKENALTFVAVIPLTLYFFTPVRFRDQINVLIPLLIASIAYIVIRTNVIGYLLNSGKEIDDLMNDPFLEMNGMEKLATILYTMGEYLRLLIFPHPLTHDYYPYHVPIMNFAKPGTLISLALYGGLIWLFFKGWSKKTVYAWSIAFFIITMSIVSNIAFPVGTFMNERFLFLSSVSFSIVCAHLWWKYGWKNDNNAIRYISLAILILVLGGYAFKTYVRIPAWKDALSLNSSAVLVSPKSARSNCFMATALYEMGRDTSDAEEKRKIFEEAEFFADRSLAIYPEYLSANQIKSGLVAERYLRDRNLDRFLQELEVIVRAKPQTEYVRQFLEYLNKREDPEKLLSFYYRMGYEYLAKERMEYPLAVMYLKIGEQLAPNDPRILFGIGKALYAGGDQVQGTQYLERAYAINPALRDMN